MDLKHVTQQLNVYKADDQVIDAAEYLIRSFGLESENFAGFGFRPELETNSILLTTEGALGAQQKVMIPKNLFDFELNLVLNMIAHEMLHVRQKAPETLVEDKNAVSYTHLDVYKRQAHYPLPKTFRLYSTRFCACFG